MIIINNIEFQGNSIVSKGNKVFIDGVDVTPDSKTINIVVNGDIESIDCGYCEKILVTGNVKTINTTSGNVDCDGDVSGSVKTTSGDVKCGNIGGDVNTMSGNVKSEGNILGSVKTMSGNIKYKKEN
jgi:predicted acyltransferase (DUF342 family)